MRSLVGSGVKFLFSNLLTKIAISWFLFYFYLKSNKTCSMEKHWTPEIKKKTFDELFVKVQEREDQRKSLKKSERSNIKSLFQIIRWMEKIKESNSGYLFQCGQKENELFEGILVIIDTVKTEKLQIEMAVLRLEQREWVLKKMYKNEAFKNLELP